MKNKSKQHKDQSKSMAGLNKNIFFVSLLSSFQQQLLNHSVLEEKAVPWFKFTVHRPHMTHLYFFSSTTNKYKYFLPENRKRPFLS